MIEIQIIEWEDSYGAISGWIPLEEELDYVVLKCIRVGVLVHETDKVIALAPHFADGTDHTPRQGNGIMVIPKSCIVKRTTFSYPSLKH